MLDADGNQTLCAIAQGTIAVAETALPVAG